MSDVRLATVGAACAVSTTAVFVVGIALMVASGVQVLIPESGKAEEWIADIDGSNGAFFVGAWLVVLGGLLGLAALIGFYDRLRGAGPIMLLAPIAGVVGMVLVTISHVIPIALAYVIRDGRAPADFASTVDVLGMLALLTNYVGNGLGWGLAVPLYAFAILRRTGELPRWLGWLGLVVAVFGGWLGLLGPAWSVIEGVTFIGFLSFFIWMAAMGIAILRRPSAERAPAGTERILGV